MIGVEEVKAQANLLKQANNLLRYELDRAVAIQKFEGLVSEKLRIWMKKGFNTPFFSPINIERIPENLPVCDLSRTLFNDNRT